MAVSVAHENLIFGGGVFCSNLAATLRPQGFSLKTMDNEKSAIKQTLLWT